jgi:FKBP-type peptidyl-prolyl cis-trans isomerase 2
VKRLTLIGCMSLVVLTNLPDAFGASRIPQGLDNTELQQTVVEKGDVVTVRFSSKESGGEVFESKSIKFRVGMGTTYRGIEQAVLGMEQGEAKTIEVSAAEGYGEIDAKKIVKIPRHRSMPRQKKISLAAFKRSAKAEPVAGKRYALRGLQWPIKVLKVEQDRVLLDLIPENETRMPVSAMTKRASRRLLSRRPESEIDWQPVMGNTQRWWHSMTRRLLWI